MGADPAWTTARYGEAAIDQMQRKLDKKNNVTTLAQATPFYEAKIRNATRERERELRALAMSKASGQRRARYLSYASDAYHYKIHRRLQDGDGDGEN